MSGRAGEDELLYAIPLVEGRLYFATLVQPSLLQFSPLAATHVCFSVDAELLYEPFFADFGPLNMGCTFRFCQRALAALEEAQQMRPPRRVYFCVRDEPQRKANAAVLAGALSVLHLSRSAEEAYQPLSTLKPFPPFRDASCGPPTYHLTVLDCLRGLQRARDRGLLDFRAPPPVGFDSAAYEHFERVENGDLNWAVPGKLIAFSGPHARRTRWAGYQSLTPEDYWESFRAAGVTAVVRLNTRLYDRRRFTEGGFRHHELFFPDGSCPTPQLVARFCALVEAEPGVVAVHCKAGLGRTGVLIGLYLMKHYGFSANEALGYLRIVRPGSVIGPQQHFLSDWEPRMWAEGDAWRASHAAGRAPERLPAPRVSCGAGGAYDDGDITDEDAYSAGYDSYDDGGYTCGSASPPRSPPPSPTRAPATGGGLRDRRAAYSPATPFDHSLSPPRRTPPPPQLPSALRMSPSKPMHSGTRPSVIASSQQPRAGAGAGSARAPGQLHGSRTMPTLPGVRRTGRDATASSDETSPPPSRRLAAAGVSPLRRSGSVRGHGCFDAPAADPGPSTRPQLGGPLRRSGTLPSSALRSASVAAISSLLSGGGADRTSPLRRSMRTMTLPGASAFGGAGPEPMTSRPPLPPTSRSLNAEWGLTQLSDERPPRPRSISPATDGRASHEAMLVQSMAAMAPPSSFTLPASPLPGTSPPGGGGAMRMVTATGQPRKVWTAAPAAGPADGA